MIRELVAREADARSKLNQSLLASTLVHELRQPLAELQLRAKALSLKLEANADSAELVCTVERLVGCAEEIGCVAGAVERLLRMQPDQYQWLDFRRLLLNRLDAITQQAEGVMVETRVSDWCDPCLMGDPVQLGMACDNLINNALQAMAGLPLARRRLLITLSTQGRWLMLTLDDGGPGLQACDLSELTLNSSRPEGMGLGLLLVATIARAHGGELRFERSAELGGARLVLTLSAGSAHDRRAGSDRAWQAEPVLSR